MGFWHTNSSPNLDQKTRPYSTQPKKMNLQNCGLCCPADYRIKLKECEKKEKYLDLARELKKLWNMKVTIIPIVTWTFGTVTKGLLKGIREWRKSGDIQTTALLRTARILRRLLKTWGDLLSIKIQWKTIS